MSKKTARFGMRLHPGVLERIDAARVGLLDETGRPLSRTGWIELHVLRGLEDVEGRALTSDRDPPAGTVRPPGIVPPARESERVPARPRLRGGIGRYLEER